MQLCALLTALAQHMRRESNAMSSDSAALAAWRTVLDCVRADFDVAIYNLNYDSVALTCWPGAFTGFDNGAFDAAAVHERPWEGLFHLHGSVHFSLDGAGRDTIVWGDDLSGAFDDSNDRAATPASDGRDFPPTSLIAGGFKLDQLLIEPFQTYQSALVRDAARADAILIGGYGFGDAHVNRTLRNALRARSARPSVLVLDHAEASTGLLAYRQDRWSPMFEQALYTTSDRSPQAARLAPHELAARGFCEATPHRVAIWYGGFLAAGGQMDRFARWLGGGEEVLSPP